MSLRAIDIASWQEGIVPSRVDCDVVIVKATGGTWYENPFFEEWADDALASGKRLAIYHYAVESQDDPDPRAEAEFFLDHVRRYRGRFVPALDWEADAMALPQEWALEWMRAVEDELGATPVFYAYASHLNSADYSKVAERYPLWMASYLSRYEGAGWVDDPRNTWDLGSWDRMLMYQYTSTGRVAGYDDDLDLSVFYGTGADWDGLCGGGADMGRRDEILDALRSQLGEDYYSMNYGASEGFGGVGTNYVGAGWGCAELASFAYNTTIGTDYVGSTWNFYGDALGQGTNQGVGEFYFVDDPEPGDIVCYINSGHNGSDYDDCGHVAVYVGDGMVIGARGIGKPTGGYYLNIGVQETSIELQSLGGGWRYIRCTRLDGEQPEHEGQKTEGNGERNMLACIISIDDDHHGYKTGMQVLWTPMGFEYINHPDSISLLDEMSVYYTGKPLMRVHSGHDHPWVARLEQVTIGDGAKTKGTVR